MLGKGHSVAYPAMVSLRDSKSWNISWATVYITRRAAKPSSGEMVLISSMGLIIPRDVYSNKRVAGYAPRSRYLAESGRDLSTPE